MALDTTGFIVNSEEEWYDNIMKEMKLKFPNISENPANLLVIMARMMARTEYLRDIDRVVAYNNSFPATAKGRPLDQIVAGIGLSRELGSNSILNLEITKDPSVTRIIIPTKTIFKSGETSYISTNTQAQEITTDTGIVEVRSVNIGTASILPDTAKFETTSFIAGITKAVINKRVADGRDKESDEMLRERYRQTMTTYKTSSLRGIKSAVAAIPEVTDVTAIENVEDTDQTIQGLTLPPHSFSLFVFGGSKEDIAEAIFKTKPAGIKTIGTESVDINDFNSVFHINFNRMQSSDIYINVTVALDLSVSTEAELITEIKNALIKHVKDHREIHWFEAIDSIDFNVENVIGVKDIKFGETSSDITHSDLTPTASKRYTTSETTITVTVV